MGAYPQMSFSVINPYDHKRIKFGRGSYFDLEPSFSVFIEPLSTAVIEHKIIVEFEEGVDNVWIARIPGTFIHHTLMIDQGPILPGSIRTEVFNFGTDRTRIEKGECISRLVAL